jgi:hypothetical protein
MTEENKMHTLIEQRKITPTQVGGSISVLIPAKWIEEMEITTETPMIMRLCKGKKGIFIDLYKE